MSLNIEAVFLLIHTFFTEESVEIPRKVLEFWEKFSAVSTFVSLLLLVVIVYSWVRLSQVRRDESAQFVPLILSERSVRSEASSRWEEVVAHAGSDNPNDWKAAVIEADKILEDIVARLNLPGETLGERLKAVEPSDFTTLNQAWEAHKIRNRIAHEAGYQLNQRDARRAIDMYQQVFEEFHYL